MEQIDASNNIDTKGGVKKSELFCHKWKKLEAIKLILHQYSLQFRQSNVKAQTENIGPFLELLLQCLVYFVY